MILVVSSNHNNSAVISLDPFSYLFVPWHWKQSVLGQWQPLLCFPAIHCRQQQILESIPFCCLDLLHYFLCCQKFWYSRLWFYWWACKYWQEVLGSLEWFWFCHLKDPITHPHRTLSWAGFHGSINLIPSILLSYVCCKSHSSPLQNYTAFLEAFSFLGNLRCYPWNIII